MHTSKYTMYIYKTGNTYICLSIISCRSATLLLQLQPRFGGNALKVRGICLHNGTAVLEGLCYVGIARICFRCEKISTIEVHPNVSEAPDLGSILTTSVFQLFSVFSRNFGIFPKYFREKPTNFTPPKSRRRGSGDPTAQAVPPLASAQS